MTILKRRHIIFAKRMREGKENMDMGMMSAERQMKD